VYIITLYLGFFLRLWLLLDSDGALNPGERAEQKKD
jgi:hypothetical protein